MDYASLLNEKQFLAVSSKSQFIRVIAGAGSGKTRVLTYRIAYLISEMHVDYSRILAFTFTNKAAREMGERASKLVNDIMGGDAPRLNISTFHAFCARFLRAEHSHLTYEKEERRTYFSDITGEQVTDYIKAPATYPIGFTIYSDDDQARLVKSIAPDLGYKKGDEIVKKAIAYIRKKKTKGIYPSDINVKNVLYEDEKISYKFYVEYEKRKTQNVALDFDDLICKTLQILEENPTIKENWSNRFDYMLVDEFQDTDDKQIKLMQLLLRNDACLFVVGDPDQTIYTWRGANQKIIVDFDARFPGAQTIILDENYRSTKIILDAANRLISHNKKRVPKDLFTKAPGGEAIAVKRTLTPEREAEWVVNEIKKIAVKQRDDNGDPVYNNIAILYRASYLTRPFESELKDRGIPYRIFGGLRFYERMEVKDLLAYFSLLTNPLDNVSFERIINVPKRGIGDTTLERIHNEAALAHLSEYEYIHHIDEFQFSEIPAKAISILKNLVVKMEETKHRMNENGETFASVLKDFVTDIGYYDYLAETEDPDEDRIKNVNALFDDINHFIERNPDSSFEQYLQNVILLSSQDDMNGGNYVSLMTIHIAKGLEFDYVFIIGMNEGAFPSARAVAETDRDGCEEERRLAYVAFTRAKKRLFLSTNSAYSYVTDSHAIPSSYFKEAGIEVPRDEYGGSTRQSWSASNKNYNKWGSSKGNGSSFKPSFFNDGNHVSPFEEKKEKPKIEDKPKPSNGVTDWALGDKAHHEVFGDGTVIDIIDNTIIVINFDNAGKKTLLASHPKLSRISKKGGAA